MTGSRLSCGRMETRRDAAGRPWHYLGWWQSTDTDLARKTMTLPQLITEYWHWPSQEDHAITSAYDRILTLTQPERPWHYLSWWQNAGTDPARETMTLPQLMTECWHWPSQGNHDITSADNRMPTLTQPEKPWHYQAHDRMLTLTQPGRPWHYLSWWQNGDTGPARETMTLPQRLTECWHWPSQRNHDIISADDRMLTLTQPGRPWLLPRLMTECWHWLNQGDHDFYLGWWQNTDTDPARETMTLPQLMTECWHWPSHRGCENLDWTRG